MLAGARELVQVASLALAGYSGRACAIFRCRAAPPPKLTVQRDAQQFVPVWATHTTAHASGGPEGCFAHCAAKNEEAGTWRDLPEFKDILSPDFYKLNLLHIRY